MAANSRAKTINEPEGFVKVISDAKTDRIHWRAYNQFCMFNNLQIFYLI
jgi:pyruvate/2-oxoglutarate dehydrogenase complex dihydrolipoamide dehydrogenase (E3) component